MLTADVCAPTRHSVYSLGFLLTAIAALTVYFNTPLLLARGFSVDTVGFVYATAAVASITALLLAPRLFTALGNYRSFLALLTLAGAAYAALALSTGPLTASLAFTAVSVSIALAAVLLDIFLKGSMTGVSGEGATRAKFITIANIAWVAFPFVGGYLSESVSLSALFLTAAALFIPTILVAAYTLASVRRHTYETPNPRRMLASIAENRNLRGVFAAQFLLRVSYAVMAIYTPVYLTEVVGMSLADLGLVTSITMLAFLLFEWPVGALADAYVGEKEFMATGFIVMAGSILLIPFVTSAEVVAWALVLFAVRTGAALVEITTESYFFKQTGASDADRVGAFRALNPVSFVAGSLIGSAVIFVAPLSYVFIVLAALMPLGVVAALRIMDTK